ncbi:MAG: UPF0175 family protein [Methanoregula sp.]|jgi:predicted HTH domain antitoxin|nr:UPF0175 family protein [Methanoregula sp.]
MPLFIFLLKLIQRGVQLDAAEDSFNYCQSIVVLRQSLITPEEITMTEVILKVPTDIVDAIRLPPDDIHAELQKELALALYKRGILSSGKACALAGLSRWEWVEILGQRKVSRHYTPSDLEKDIAHVKHRK